MFSLLGISNNSIPATAKPGSIEAIESSGKKGCNKVVSSRFCRGSWSLKPEPVISTRCVSFEVAHFQAPRAGTRTDVSALQACNAVILQSGGSRHRQRMCRASSPNRKLATSKSVSEGSSCGAKSLTHVSDLDFKAWKHPEVNPALFLRKTPQVHAIRGQLHWWINGESGRMPRMSRGSTLLLRLELRTQGGVW